jgi:5-methylcytosine-specific restriction enzyme subunit McrC
VILGDGWEFRIRPKLAIPRLLFLLAYSRQAEGWKDMTAGFEEESDIFDAVAHGYAWQLERSLERGVLRGYVQVEERSLSLRGRLRFADQIARNAGVGLPLEVTYDDHTADIPENRLLLAATEILLRLPRIAARARSRLLRARAALEEVQSVALPRGTTAPAITRLNARYGPALALAELIVNARSVGAEGGDVRSAGFLFDMNAVFEDFLYAALKDAFRPFRGEVQHHFRDYLDTDPSELKVVPDITWWRGGKCRAVLDAKYKSLVERRAMPNADAYQMLAYCITLDLPRGFLIYAKDGPHQTRRHVIKRHGYTIDVRAIDVEAEPAELLRQVNRIAADIAEASLAAA